MNVTLHGETACGPMARAEGPGDGEMGCDGRKTG